MAVDLQGPVEIYIGNTHPGATKERVEVFLKENAAVNNIHDFKVDKIVTLN